MKIKVCFLLSFTGLDLAQGIDVAVHDPETEIVAADHALEIAVVAPVPENIEALVPVDPGHAIGDDHETETIEGGGLARIPAKKSDVPDLSLKRSLLDGGRQRTLSKRGQ